MRIGGASVTLAGLVAVLGCESSEPSEPEVRVGSKKFTESVVLGEVVSELARNAGASATHAREIGGTQVLFRALLRGDIDVYPEYSGTFIEEILAREGVAKSDISSWLHARGLRQSGALGFNNTYALGMREEVAARLGIVTISDLGRHPELQLGFSNEFLARSDGWPGLRDRYGLRPEKVSGLDHDLAYRALESGAIAVTDLYSTDAEIEHYAIRVLTDDRTYFPDYSAMLLYRAELASRAPRAVAAFRRLEGAISSREMIAMNARAKLERVQPARIAAEFLRKHFAIRAVVHEESRFDRLLATSRDHLTMVVSSLLAAIAMAVPLGIIAAKRPTFGHVILAVIGVIQTIPSLALLVFMIPLFGIGATPAMIALFLYSLLPIVRNTHAGLIEIPIGLRESAEALGLSPWARLRLIEIPLAMRNVLAGIKTSAVLNVGNATLGAVIGAGGYGQPILTGIRLNDVGLILEGAIPAAVLALVAQLAFDGLERWAVSKGLRLNPAK